MVSPEAFLAACPSRAVLGRIGEKWTLMVVVALAPGARRFGHLQRQLEGVSQKVLTRSLRNLERDGFVRRRDYGEIPRRVEYNLTPLGRSFLPLAQTLKQWAEEHLLEIEANAERFDARASQR